jgi:hypothetical protein
MNHACFDVPLAMGGRRTDDPQFRSFLPNEVAGR